MFISSPYIIQQLINGLILGLSYSLIAVGLTLVFGILRIVNFSHGQFYMLGAYLAYAVATQLKINYFASIFLAIIFTYIVGYICTRLIVQPLQERDELVMMIATLGLGSFIENSCLHIWSANPRQLPTPYSSISIHFGEISIIQQRALNFIIGIMILALIWLFINNTKIGKLMKATGQNKLGALILGVNVKKIGNFTFAFSCALAACSGAFIASTSTIYPYIGMTAMIKAFIVVILGGLGSVIGAMVGGMLLGVSEALGGALTAGQYQDLIGYIAVVIVLLIKPSGLFGDPKDI
jgi:branched-chain amino acid transport system permease protein